MEDPLSIIAREHGVFLRREAIACSYTDKMLASLCRQRILHRVRHGAYCFHDVWSTATDVERHLILARAVLRMTPGQVALSHTTALLVHGVAVWGADLSRVHLTRLDKGAGRSARDMCHHVGVCRDDDVVERGGLTVTTVDRAVIEAATILGTESGVVSADSAMHLGLTDPATLHSRFKQMNHWVDSRKIHVLLGWMDGRAESAGESRARVLFRREGLPRPELQFEVHDHAGRLLAVTDFVWHDHRAFGEFDGKVKYEKYRREGETPGDTVFREKQREDKVRAITGYVCGRMVWSDLSRPATTAAYFRHVLGLD